MRVVACQQFYGAAGVAEPADGVDAGSDDEYDLSRADGPRSEVCAFDDRLDTRTRVRIYFIETEFYQYPVFALEGNDIRGARQAPDIIEILERLLLVAEGAGEYPAPV
jgi:hypothetical protein